MRCLCTTGRAAAWFLVAMTVHCVVAADEVDQAFGLRLDGKAEQARQQLQTIVAQQPQSAKAWYELARAQFYLFQFDEALQAIDKAIELQPGNAAFHRLAGTAAAYNAVQKYKSPDTRDQLGPQMKRWLEELEKAVAITPNDYDLCVELANAYVRTPAEQGGDASKAEALIKRLESLSPVHGAKARSITMQSDPNEQRIALWEGVVAKAAEDPDAHAELAGRLMHAGNLERAATEVDKAIALDAAHSTLLLDLGRTAGMRQAYDQAEEVLTRYLQLKPQPPAPLRAVAMFYRAAIQKRRGFEAEANELLKQAKALDAHVWTTLQPPPPILFEKL